RAEQAVHLADAVHLAAAREARRGVRVDAHALRLGELAVEVGDQLLGNRFAVSGRHRYSVSSLRMVAVARNTRLLTALSVQSSASATSRYDIPSTLLNTKAARWFAGSSARTA